MNTVNEVNANQVTGRTEKVAATMDGQKKECASISDGKKRGIVTLNKDRTNVSQVKKLGKNTARKRRRAQEFETGMSVQNEIEIKQETTNLNESIIVEPTAMAKPILRTSNSETEGQQGGLICNDSIIVETTAMPKTTLKTSNSGDAKVYIGKHSEPELPFEEPTNHKGDQPTRSYVEVCRETKVKIQVSSSGSTKPTMAKGNCVLSEIDEHLFNLPRDVPLAYCIAEDLRMEGAMGSQFKRYFGGIGQLMDQNLTTGNVGVIINDQKETAFYLVTRKYLSGRATMETLSNTLKSLLEKMKSLKLTKLGIPKIGCLLDGLDWLEVKKLIANVFSGSGIQITVCVPSKIFYHTPRPQLKVFVTPKKMLDVTDKMSDILLFIDHEQCQLEGWKNDLVDKLNIKYPTFKDKLMKDISGKQLKPGDATFYFINKERLVCVFTSPSAFYGSIEKGFINIKNTIRCYRNFAMQSGPIKPADNFKHISRTVMILRSIVYSSELWLCGDTDQTVEKAVYEECCRKINNDNRLSSRPTNYNERKDSVVKRNTLTTTYKKGKKSQPTRHLR